MTKHIFGPVPSRRLGISLGVDIIPFKTCTLDCIYCECGKTTNHTMERLSFFSPEKLLSELKIFFKEKIHLDYVTFSGSGEPTLNSDIGLLIREIKKMTEVPVAILTNGTLLSDPEVREELSDADIILPSLDAASEKVFKMINRPVKGIDVDSVIKGIIEFSEMYKGEIWLEVFISKGINDSYDEIVKLHSVIKKIKPKKVQLNSLDRPPAYSEAEVAGRDLLESIVKKWNDLPVEIIKRIKNREEIASFSKNLENNIVNTISRRPLTIDDLIVLTGKNRLELFKYIDVLEKEKKIRTEIAGDKIFFRPFKSTK